MDFFKYKNKLQPGKGRILVSEPFLPDPNFERTIVLLCEHNEDGSFGFVINKPSVAKIGDVMEELEQFDVPLFVGGPVQQDTLHYIHRYANLQDAVQITEDTYWGGNFESLKAMINSAQVDKDDLKFFLGYSGWSEGQLDEEMEANSWIVSDKFSAELLFETDPDLMWKESLRSMGGRFSVFSNYPVDPRQN
ncbi:MAG: YqgE/AlgH family protein [Cyclobacteriaceae bacterium]